MSIVHKVSVIVLSGVLLSGCVIQSRQLNFLKGLIEEPSLNLSESKWSLKYSDYESVVYAVSIKDGVLFSNEKGDQLLFDGWALRHIKGLGKQSLEITISDIGQTRNFYRNGIAVESHLCDQWKIQRNSDITRFLQSCDSQERYKNSILIDTNDSISLIRQIVDERYTALKLTKLE